jgi:hypothetical protein
MNLRKGRMVYGSPTKLPPAQPNYQDELTTEQLEVIAKLVDPDGNRASQRKLIYSAGW